MPTDDFRIKQIDTSLHNEDLAPLPPGKRKWGWFEIFNVWSNDIQSLFGYTLAATLFISYGLSGWAVLAGDSVHAFGDGILIASAFLADMRLGVITSLAVLAHEVPHHIGDLVVLRHTSGTSRAALVKVSLAGTVTAIGGVVGYFLVTQLQDYLPFFLVAASSSFVYVALADLIPQLQKKLGFRDTVAQVAWLLAGIALVTLVSSLAH